MANLASQVVEAYLKAQGINSTVVDESGNIRTGFRFDGGTIDMLIVFSDDGSHVSVQGFNFITVPKDKIDSLYKVFNQLNSRYKHFKFYYEEKLEMLFVDDDDIIQLDTCGEECYELIMRMANVVEDAYPVLMKAIWA